MNILNIIDTIYESKWFPTILIISMVVLVVLFIAVILLGLKDARKSQKPKKEKPQDLKDITFAPPTDQEAISEDVTFEIPVLTKDLETFKKILEEEIEKEEKINVIKEPSKEEKKKTKVLDKDEIDSTSVIPMINVNTIEKPVKEEIQEEVPRPPKREILKELFKDRKQKEVEPPTLKVGEQKKEVEQPSTQPEKIITTQTKQSAASHSTPKETKYSGDDDF